MQYKWRILSSLTGLALCGWLSCEIASVKSDRSYQLKQLSPLIQQISEVKIPIEIIANELAEEEKLEVIEFTEDNGKQDEVVEPMEEVIQEQEIVDEPQLEEVKDENPEPPKEKEWSPPDEPITVSENPNHETIFVDRNQFARQWKHKLLDTSRQSWWVENENWFKELGNHYMKSDLFTRSFYSLWNFGSESKGKILMETCREAYSVEWKSTQYELSQDIWSFCQKQ